MEETSWYISILANPFFRGLAIGLIVCLFFWVRSLLRIRELSKNVTKLREHLHTKLEIDSAENERRKIEIERLKEERDNLRNMIQVLSQKPGRQEIRQAQVYQRAIDIMFEKAPGFAPAWQITLKEAEEAMQQAERGLLPFLKRMTGTPGKAHDDFEGERKKALEMKPSGS
jgi:regulator of replication initiation timing